MRRVNHVGGSEKKTEMPNKSYNTKTIRADVKMLKEGDWITPRKSPTLVIRHPLMLVERGGSSDAQASGFPAGGGAGGGVPGPRAPPRTSRIGR